jgi:ATP-binding cassette subfamily F protein uup
VTVTLGLDGSGRVDVVAGGYDDWVKKRFEDHRPAQRNETRHTAVLSKNGVRAGPARKLTYRDQRDLDRLPAKLSGWNAKSPRMRRVCTIPICFRAIRSASPC